MKRSAGIAACLIAVAGVYWLVQAGNLEPPGPPAPTMVTLEQIDARLDALSVGVIGVARTGQTGCWDELGFPIPCSGTGQDGELQKGVSVAPRFTDNADGTVKDNLTGLIWLTNAQCFGLRSWADALSDSTALADPACGLSDGSVQGDWRLPNILELVTLIDFAQVNPAVPSGHPFSNVEAGKYWSSATWVSGPTLAWAVNLGVGGAIPAGKVDPGNVWPVRGGQ